MSDKPCGKCKNCKLQYGYAPCIELNKGKVAKPPKED